MKWFYMDVRFTLRADSVLEAEGTLNDVLHASIGDTIIDWEPVDRGELKPESDKKYIVD